VVIKAWRADPTHARDGQGLFFNPLSPAAALIVLPGLALAWARRVAFGPMLAAALVLLGCSVVPGLFFYPVVHTMMGVFAAVALIVYLVLAALAAAAAGWGRARSTA
jgi:hypothetical protein